MIILYIFLTLIGIFMLFQLSVVLSAKKKQGTKVDGLPKNLSSLEKKGASGLVYFFSPSCRACKTQSEIINELKISHKNIFEVDISKDFATAQKFGIKATPTTIAISGGVIEKVFVGVKPKGFLEKYFKENK